MKKTNCLIAFSVMITQSGCYINNACPTYNVETGINEFRNIKTCSLSNNRLKDDYTSNGELIKTTFGLEKQEDDSTEGTISMHITGNKPVGANGKPTNFRSDSIFIFKVYHNNQIPEEIRVTSCKPNDNSQWFDIKTYKDKDRTVEYQTVYHTVSTANICLTREQLTKIAQADKILYAFETSQKPIKGELSGKGIIPLKEYVQKCYQ